MSTTTSRQGLTKPATTDQALISDINTNSDTIDTYTVWLNKSNTVTSAFGLDASAAPVTTGIRLPNGAGAAPSTAGVTAYDSTARAVVYGDGSATRRLLAASVTNDGLTGATAASRYVGATASGAPASGTFAVGDFVIAQDGMLWVCTVAGSQGTWVRAVPVPFSNTTLTAHGVVVGNGSSAVAVTAVGATNTVLHGNTGADPSYSAIVNADITDNVVSAAKMLQSEMGTADCSADQTSDGTTQDVTGCTTGSLAAGTYDIEVVCTTQTGTAGALVSYIALAKSDHSVFYGAANPAQSGFSIYGTMSFTRRVTLAAPTTINMVQVGSAGSGNPSAVRKLASGGVQGTWMNWKRVY